VGQRAADEKPDQSLLADPSALNAAIAKSAMAGMQAFQSRASSPQAVSSLQKASTALLSLALAGK
jgi:hypothetical protein